MIDHNTLIMKHADRQVKDKELIKAMLDQCPVCTLAIQDEPYPYEVPLNFGYKWDDKLTIYMHMTSEGYKRDLINKNPNVCWNAYGFVDRSLWGTYRNEHQDYRSVTVFGKVEIIDFHQPDEFLKGLNSLQVHYKRKKIIKAPQNEKLLVIKLVADVVTAKSMYPINNLEEVKMPTNEDLEKG